VVESDIQKAILDYLLMNQVYCWRNNTGAYKVDNRFIRFGKKGSSDILGILRDGRFLAIEVKQPDKEPTEDQKEFLQAIAENNGIALVAHSLDEVMEDLNGLL